MGESETRPGGRKVVVTLLVLATFGLAGVVVYLLSQLNHRRYQLAVVGEQLVVQRGRMFPVGFATFEPEATDLNAAYAPISLPKGAQAPAGEQVEDRVDIDRALFAVLAGWARERLDAKEDAEFDLATGYVRRCELLPGLSEDQRQELKALRAGLAFRRGKRIVEGVAARLREALDELETAKGLGGTQLREVDARIANVEAKLRVNNPDDAERTRDLFPEMLMEDHFFPLDGQVSAEGVWRILEEHKAGDALPASVRRSDVDEVLRTELVQEAWTEVSQTDEVKYNMERLRPVIERVGY